MSNYRPKSPPVFQRSPAEHQDPEQALMDEVKAHELRTVAQLLKALV